ncbi:ER membrane protein complex subunit 1 [Harmonia axyridis]|uniref:ER membrane protein complex subunit 1 n=1 Tax=Harmonia axyridis TaxID=115357 RepID=UPI001E278D3B|nr:ER membrane protein complex subunit 1 [Harmonia axyridis]XP_045463625.1 ER membrane protein complex subunit 1 [Harmonia axyridis]XP_045463626.1 ER membrane protein complex subunit 1 [Harmonia axyridis]
MARNIFYVSLELPLLFLYIILFFTQSCSGLYEDQVGKFDWKKSFIGKVKYASFESDKLIVGTEANVLACLNVKNGNIIWRQVMENAAEQQIQQFQVNKAIISISGADKTWYVRGWEISSGVLLWEWTLNLDAVFTTTYWSIIEKEKLIHIIPTEASHIEVFSYHLESGETKMKAKQISSPWLKNVSKCVVTAGYFVCILNNNGKDEIKYINLEINSPQVSSISIDLSDSGEAEILNFENEIPSVLVVKDNIARIVQFKDKVEIFPSPFLKNVISVKNDDEDQLFQLEINLDNPKKLLRLTRENSIGENKLLIDLEYPKGLGVPYLIAGVCRKNICDLLLSSIDHALILVRIPEGKIIWTREEALSDIIAVEFFELPVSELDASIENEFKISSQDIFSMFLHRISTQTRQLSNSLFGSKLQMDNMLVRDDFGLHKIIVVVTRIGKLFGIDTLSGQIVWSYRIPHILPFDNDHDEVVLLLVQRTARYSPLPAQCTLLAKDAMTGYTIMFQFDPITGYSSQGIVRINKKVKQTMLLPYEDTNHLKPFITINNDDIVEVYPKEARHLVESHLSSIYFYMVTDTSIEGYSLNSESGRLKASLNWNFLLGSSKLLATSVRPTGERVHSQGRVLPDRSVYYKYVNPNMIAVATVTDDPVHKQVLSVYLLDGITGFVIYSLAHKKARGPVNLVHSENWLVYTFFNERYRRTELAALELYEGHIQSNSTVFSSYAMSQLPQVQTQSYILPALPTKVTVTLTERGITNKCLLVALSTGAVVEIPWALVQPRFADIPCGPEESCYPYMPEIPLNPEAAINYNQTLSKVNGISVAPARLESTSHILVYGLDIFYTRVAPSKTFDVLKEDFDHKLIILVLIGLILASYVTKTLASRKAVKQAWK